MKCFEFGKHAVVFSFFKKESFFQYSNYTCGFFLFVALHVCVRTSSSSLAVRPVVFQVCLCFHRGQSCTRTPQGGAE